MPRLVERGFKDGELLFNDDGKIRKYCATTCGHGNEVIVRKRRSELGRDYFLCPQCRTLICPKCAHKQADLKGECVVFEQRLLMMEGRLPKVEREKAWILGALMFLVKTLQPMVVFDGNSLTHGDGCTNPATQNPCVQTMALIPGRGWRHVDNGVPDRATPQQIIDAPTQVDPSFNSRNRRNVCFMWEITNDIGQNLASAATAYANIVSYCQARQAVGWYVVVVTCLPRSDFGDGIPADFETRRTTVNTNIRNNWPTFANALADPGGDANIGQAGDDTNLTYYISDHIHLNEVGTAIVAQEWAAILAGL